MINITKENLQKILSEAYQAGWHGSLELKESIVENIISKFCDSSKNPQQSFYISPSNPNPVYDAHQLTLNNFGDMSSNSVDSSYNISHVYNESQGTITINLGPEHPIRTGQS